MKKLIYLFSTLILLALFTACSKTETTFTPDPVQPPLDTNWVANPGNTIIDRYLEDISKPFFTDSITSGVINTREYISEKLKIIYPQDCFSEPGGAAINGQIKLQIKVLRTKGDYVKSRISTINNTALLNNNFYINIKAFYNGHEVIVKPGSRIVIDCTDAPSASGNFQVYYGSTTSSTVDWSGAVNTPLSYTTVNTSEASYRYYADRTGWSAVGSLYANGISTTKIFVTLPIMYTNVNTQAFLVFNDTKTAIRMTADVNGKFFYQGALPAGKNFSVVSVSVINGTYYWGMGPATVSPNLIIQLHPAQSNPSAINNFLSSL